MPGQFGNSGGKKGRSGRKPMSHNRNNTQLTIAETSPKAARYLADVLAKVENPNPSIIEVCKYIIDQDLGRPTQKTILAGDKEAPLKTFVFVLPEGVAPQLVVGEGKEDTSGSSD